MAAQHESVGSGLSQVEWESETLHNFKSGTAYPGSPVSGQMFFKWDDDELSLYTGGNWEELTHKDEGVAALANADISPTVGFHMIFGTVGTTPDPEISTSNGWYGAGENNGQTPGIYLSAQFGKLRVADWSTSLYGSMKASGYGFKYQYVYGSTYRTTSASHAAYAPEGWLTAGAQHGVQLHDPKAGLWRDQDYTIYFCNGTNVRFVNEGAVSGYAHWAYHRAY